MLRTSGASRERHVQQRLLLQLVGFVRAGGRGGAGGALDGADAWPMRRCEARLDERKRSHVRRLFLHPDEIAGARMLGERFFERALRGRDRSGRGGGWRSRCPCGGRAPLQARGRSCRCRTSTRSASCTSRSRTTVSKRGAAKSPIGETASGMAQHALRGEDDERLAPLAQSLAAQEMEVLRRIGRLADLHVVAGAELEIALDAGAGVFRPLPFVAVRQEQGDAGEEVPLVFAGDDELIDDDLRAVGEVAELGLPHHQGFGIVAGKAVLEAHDGGFGKLGAVDLDPRLVGREMRQRHVLVFVLGIDKSGVA